MLLDAVPAGSRGGSGWGGTSGLRLCRVVLSPVVPAQQRPILGAAAGAGLCSSAVVPQDLCLCGPVRVWG